MTRSQYRNVTAFKGPAGDRIRSLLTRWINSLQVVDPIADVITELTSGSRLMELICRMEGKIGPTISFDSEDMMTENHDLVFEAFNLVRQRPNVNLDRLCAEEDFTARNPAQVLMALYEIFLSYGYRPMKERKAELFAWLNALLHPYAYRVSDIAADCRDGRTLCYIAHFHFPDSLAPEVIVRHPKSAKDAIHNLDLAVGVLNFFRVPVFLTPADWFDCCGGIPQMVFVQLASLRQRLMYRCAAGGSLLDVAVPVPVRGLHESLSLPLKQDWMSTRKLRASFAVGNASSPTKSKGLDVSVRSSVATANPNPYLDIAVERLDNALRQQQLLYNQDDYGIQTGMREMDLREASLAWEEEQSVIYPTTTPTIFTQQNEPVFDGEAMEPSLQVVQGEQEQPQYSLHHSVGPQMTSSASWDQGPSLRSTYVSDRRSVSSSRAQPETDPLEFLQSYLQYEVSKHAAGDEEDDCLPLNSVTRRARLDDLRQQQQQQRQAAQDHDLSLSDLGGRRGHKHCFDNTFPARTRPRITLLSSQLRNVPSYSELERTRARASLSDDRQRNQMKRTMTDLDKARQAFLLRHSSAQQKKQTESSLLESRMRGETTHRRARSGSRRSSEESPKGSRERVSNVIHALAQPALPLPRDLPSRIRPTIASLPVSLGPSQIMLNHYLSPDKRARTTHQLEEPPSADQWKPTLSQATAAAVESTGNQSVDHIKRVLAGEISHLWLFDYSSLSLLYQLPDYASSSTTAPLPRDLQWLNGRAVFMDQFARELNISNPFFTHSELYQIVEGTREDLSCLMFNATPRDECMLNGYIRAITGKDLLRILRHYPWKLVPVDVFIYPEATLLDLSPVYMLVGDTTAARNRSVFYEFSREQGAYVQLVRNDLSNRGSEFGKMFDDFTFFPQGETVTNVPIEDPTNSVFITGAVTDAESLVVKVSDLIEAGYMPQDHDTFIA